MAHSPRSAGELTACPFRVVSDMLSCLTSVVAPPGRSRRGREHRWLARAATGRQLPCDERAQPWACRPSRTRRPTAPGRKQFGARIQRAAPWPQRCRGPSVIGPFDAAPDRPTRRGDLGFHLCSPPCSPCSRESRCGWPSPVSYTHLRAHETVLDLVCRLLLEKK